MATKHFWNFLTAFLLIVQSPILVLAESSYSLDESTFIVGKKMHNTTTLSLLSQSTDCVIQQLPINKLPRKSPLNKRLKGKLGQATSQVADITANISPAPFVIIPSKLPHLLFHPT